MLTCMLSSVFLFFTCRLWMLNFSSVWTWVIYCACVLRENIHCQKRKTYSLVKSSNIARRGRFMMDSEIDKTIERIRKRNSPMEFPRKLGRFFLILPCVKLCTCKSRFDFVSEVVCACVCLLHQYSIVQDPHKYIIITAAILFPNIIGVFFGGMFSY